MKFRKPHHINNRQLCAPIYVKYLNKMVEVEIDRPLNSLHPKYRFKYKVNYGFVPNTQAPDGEEVDVYVLGIQKPLKQYKGICIAIIHRRDDNDDKLVVVPENADIKQFTNERITEDIQFQEKYFNSIIVR